MLYLRSLRPVLILALLLGACGLTGPNTFRARGTVLNPLYDQTKADAETGHPPPILMIQRKETRSQQVSHTIVGPYQKPMALKVLGEFCEIIPHMATPGRLVFQCLLYTNYKDELVDMSFGYALKLPDGRRIPGRIHTKYPVRNHTVSVTGAHRQPYMLVRDKQNKTVTQYTYIQEVENEFPLFSRGFKVIFEDKDLLDLKTPAVTLVIDGYQRRWIYQFDFTNDPSTAMRWWVEHVR